MTAAPVALCVDPEMVRAVWPHVSHLIRMSAWRGGNSRFEYTEDAVLDGHALLWIAWGDDKILGCAVTELHRTDRDLACIVLACGGEQVRRWIHLIAAIEDYARAEKCDCVRLFGRRGWARLLTSYRETKIILERPL